jgi:hypothetical protein
MVVRVCLFTRWPGLVQRLKVGRGSVRAAARGVARLRPSRGTRLVSSQQMNPRENPVFQASCSDGKIQ